MDPNDKVSLLVENDHLRDEIERLLTALRFYADANHYPRQLTGEGGFRSPVLIDGGHQAREAIGKQC